MYGEESRGGYVYPANSQVRSAMQSGTQTAN